MKSKAVSSVTFVLSIASVVLAFLDALNIGTWLSASSWLVVAAVLGIWAIYTNDK